MIELTELQLQVLDQPEPTAVDPRTNEQYVLVRKDLYDRMRGIFDEDDPRLMAPLLANLDPEDWEDAAAYEGKP